MVTFYDLQYLCKPVPNPVA